MSRSRVIAAGLSDIAEKLDAGERLSFEDGVRLFAAPDLLAVGWLANREREKRHGARTFYNYNIRVEATNVCVASCLFCSFARLQPGDPGSYTMSLEQTWDKLRRRAAPAADRNPRRQRPPSRAAVRVLPGHAARVQTHQARYPSEVLHGGGNRVLRRPLRDDGRTDAERAAGRRARLAAGGRRRDLRRTRSKEDRHDKCGADRYLDIHRLAHGSACAPT